VGSSPTGESAAPDPAHPTAREALHSSCPAHEVLGHLASRWSVLVLRTLTEGPLRYHELRAQLGGVSDKMLTSTLRTLTGDGLVDRTVLPTAPPQVYYALTALGNGAATAMGPLLDWIRDHAEALIGAESDPARR